MIRAFFRYGAALVLLVYGFAKINGSQFTILDSELDKPMGRVSGFWLTWYYFGYSKEIYSLEEGQFTMAESLLERYAFGLRLRALDALQLAVAMELREQGLIDPFVAADRILCEVAEREGFLASTRGIPDAHAGASTLREE